MDSALDSALHNLVVLQTEGNNLQFVCHPILQRKGSSGNGLLIENKNSITVLAALTGLLVQHSYGLFFLQYQMTPCRPYSPPLDLSLQRCTDSADSSSSNSCYSCSSYLNTNNSCSSSRSSSCDSRRNSCDSRRNSCDSRSRSCDMDTNKNSVSDVSDDNNDDDEDDIDCDSNTQPSTVNVDDDDDDDDDVILTDVVPATPRRHSGIRVAPSDPILILSDSDSDDVTLIQDVEYEQSKTSKTEPSIRPSPLPHLTVSKDSQTASLNQKPIKQTKSQFSSGATRFGRHILPHTGMKRIYEDGNIDDDDSNDDDIDDDDAGLSSSSALSSSLSSSDKSSSNISVINGHDPFLSDASRGDVSVTSRTMSFCRKSHLLGSSRRDLTRGSARGSASYTSITDQDDTSSQTLFDLFSSSSGNTADDSSLDKNNLQYGKPFLSSQSVITYPSLKDCSGSAPVVASELSLKDPVLSGSDISTDHSYSSSQLSVPAKTSDSPPSSLTFAISQLLSNTSPTSDRAAYRTVTDMSSVLDDVDDGCNQYSCSNSVINKTSSRDPLTSHTSKTLTSNSASRSSDTSGSYVRHKQAHRNRARRDSDSRISPGLDLSKSSESRDVESRSVSQTQTRDVESRSVGQSLDQSESEKRNKWRIVKKGDCKVLLRRSQSMTTAAPSRPSPPSTSLSVIESSPAPVQAKRSRRSVGGSYQSPPHTSVMSGTSPVGPGAGTPPIIVIVEEDKQMCYGCRTEVVVSHLSYCMAGHGCCGVCLQSQVKTLLALGRKGTLKCRYVACNSFYLVSQLRNSLPPMVVEILEEKLDREYCENAAKLMLQADNSSYSTTNPVSSAPIGEDDLMGGAEERGSANGSSAERPSDGFVIELPKNWEPMNPTEEFRLVELVRGCEEYKFVSALFHQSMTQPRASIVRIRRVQNQILWQFYIVKKRQMERESSKPVLEKNLFHGTGRSVVESICRHNFDWRLCGSHGTMYGQGSYFARDASYSHMYTDPPVGRPMSSQVPLPPPPPSNPSHMFNLAMHQPVVVQPGSSGGGPPGGSGQGGPTPQQLLFHAAYPGSSHSVSIAALQSCRFSRLPVMSQQPSPLLGGASQSTNSNSSSTSNSSQSHNSAASFPHMNFSHYWVGGPRPSLQQPLSAPLALGVTSRCPPLKSAAMQQSSGGVKDKDAPKSSPQVHCMFLARVMVGDYSLGRSNFRKPPPIDTMNPYGRCYDSCVNDTNNPSIYVIFNHAQCYPEYTIEYTNLPREQIMI